MNSSSLERYIMTIYTDIAEVSSAWSSKLFMQELHSMNIGARPTLTPYEYASY